MADHVRQIAEELRECAQAKKGKEVIDLTRILAKQLARMDAEDFPPDARVEFLKLRQSLEGWVDISPGGRAYGVIYELADSIVCVLDKRPASESADRTPADRVVSSRDPNYLEKCKSWAFSHKWLAVIIIAVLVLSSLTGLLCGLLALWRFVHGG